uniref:Uncharacterized protein n=1 Tax=Tanacetum cinerariifolium TaxID=118510 RepID=A0A6L2N345_TANCI|nr:hypothetical protein [Tanacetum cinerariifolium]
MMDQMMKKGKDMYEQMSRFMGGMTIGSIRQAKPDPIIVSQHYGLRDFSGFQSNQNIMNRPRREHHPSIYRKCPYMDFPPTTVLPKKRGGKSKNKGKKANVSPFNLGNAFNDGDVEGDDVMITGEQDTVTARNLPTQTVGCLETGNHWVTGAINLTHSVFYVLDSLHSDTIRVLLEQQISAWTPLINGILQTRGYFNGTRRQPTNFIVSYNQGWGQQAPQQPNFKDLEL